MTESLVLYDLVAPAAVLTINRADKLNALSFDTDLSFSSVSSSEAIRVQLEEVTFTVTARMAVTSLAWHWLAHM